MKVNFKELDPMDGHSCEHCNNVYYEINSKEYYCALLDIWISAIDVKRPNDCAKFDTVFHTDFKRI